MAFSWKQIKKDAVRDMRQRVQIYLKNGRNVEATKLKAKIDRLIKDG